ncbi:hypothetical protein ABZN20_12545 [Methylococcus sp. ANG]|uniref:hypothetical protein n=1 Tax=Methylococcus sp. ANG TaxID=3231903 RepID=UPI003458448F
MTREFEDPNNPACKLCRDCEIYFKPARPWHVQCPKCWRLELKATGNGLTHLELSRLRDRSLVIDGFVAVVDDSGGGGIEGYTDQELMHLFRCWLGRERDRIAQERDVAARRRSIRAVPDPDDYDDDPPPKAA